MCWEQMVTKWDKVKAGILDKWDLITEEDRTTYARRWDLTQQKFQRRNGACRLSAKSYEGSGSERPSLF